MGAFYEQIDEQRFAATEATRGPWAPDSQHAGPPCALLGRAFEAARELPAARVVRATFEILSPVPISELTVSARVLRPGRSVELLEGEIAAGEKTVVRGRAWRIRTSQIGSSSDPAPGELPPPSAGQPREFFDTGHEVGYHSAIDSRFISGSFREPGPAKAWLRVRLPLVDGEEISPLQRVLAAADSGNGVSAPLDYEHFLFINTDLSVALARLPEGEWIGMESHTAVEPDGIGLTDTRLHDERGPIGRATQSLLVAPR